MKLQDILQPKVQYNHQIENKVIENNRKSYCKVGTAMTKE